MTHTMLLAVTWFLLFKFYTDKISPIIIDLMVYGPLHHPSQQVYLGGIGQGIKGSYIYMPLEEDIFGNKRKS